MDVYLDPHFERTYRQEKTRIRKYGKQMADKMEQRMNELLNADNLEHMRNAPGHTEALRYNRSGQFSIRLIDPSRFIFVPFGDPSNFNDAGNIIWSKVTAVKIIEFQRNYHKEG